VFTRKNPSHFLPKPASAESFATTIGYAPVWQGQLHHAVPSVLQRRGEREKDEEGDG
jgi:hypothetical protein